MNVEEMVKRYEELLNGSGGRKVVVRTGGRAEQIRRLIRELLKKHKDGVLMSLVVQVLREEYKEQDYRKVRIWVENAVNVKSSGLKLEKRDGRVWIVKA